MTAERRAQYGLEPGDDLQASDHYIVVADFSTPSGHQARPAQKAN